MHRLIKAEPQLLFHRGEFQRDAMRRQRITESELLADIRANGHGAVEAVESVVMETDGTISVVSDVDQRIGEQDMHDRPYQVNFSGSVP